MSEREQDALALQLDDDERHAEHQRGPKSDAQRAPHHARLARAERLRGERRDGRHEPHAEHEADEQHNLRQRRAGHGLVAEPADQHEIAGHHRDLPELGEAQSAARDGPSRRSRRAKDRGRMRAAISTGEFVMARTVEGVVARARLRASHAFEEMRVVAATRIKACHAFIAQLMR